MNNLFCSWIIASLMLISIESSAEPPEISVETIGSWDHTILDQPFVYPEGQSNITAAIITVKPHAKIDLHKHPVPLFVYILQGSITVTYDDIGEIVYRTGDAFIEAFNWPHRARNSGRGVVKILTVYSGAKGIENSIPVD